MSLVLNKCLALAAACLLLATTVTAGSLDGPAATDAFLAPLAEALDARGIDVIHNLNHRDFARGRPERPRLGRFPDLPLPSYPDSLELRLWEQDHREGNLGGLALIDGRNTLAGDEEFLRIWLDSDDSERLFISFSNKDLQSAEAIAEVAMASGWQVLLVQESRHRLAAELYATAAQRLAIDSAGARNYRGEVPELAWLGERVRRNSGSLFRDPGNRDERRLARSEPPVFRKESLGDEFSESTIREIVVPGGVALGETAQLPDQFIGVVFANDELRLLDTAGNDWRLPPIASRDLKALFDFASRSAAIGSDAIVDIDARERVSISAALRDTDAGYAIIVADRVPFEYVRNLSVIKSVIIDTGVDWFTSGGGPEHLGFSSDFEVRFLSADNMRIAQTRAALEYAYESDGSAASYVGSWGRDSDRLRENLDYAGLGEEVKSVARYAGWIGLWRAILEKRLQFTHGRYEFMKLDSQGRETPARY